MRLGEWKDSDEKKLIEDGLNQKVAEFKDARISGILKNRISPSKRLRSYIFLLLTESSYKELRSDLLELCIALEFIQQASLIFDDTVDDDGMRDGDRIPLHLQFGGSISAAGKADHLGEFLLTQGELCIYNCNLPDGLKLEIMRSVTEAKLLMVQAQFADVFESVKPEEVSWTDWCLGVSFQKTSEFMALPFRMASIIQNMGDGDKKQMTDCGKSLGIIYQIFDDLMDIRAGVKHGTLSLTFQLAFLLDRFDELPREDSEFLNHVMAERRLCDSDADELTKLFRKYEEVIVRAALEEVSKRTSQIVLPKGVSGYEKIIEIIRTANDSAYWNYQVV